MMATVGEAVVGRVRAIPSYWYVVTVAAVVGALAAVVGVVGVGAYLRGGPPPVDVPSEEVSGGG
jgi:hypothetical protein